MFFLRSVTLFALSLVGALAALAPALIAALCLFAAERHAALSLNERASALMEAAGLSVHAAVPATGGGAGAWLALALAWLACAALFLKSQLHLDGVRLGVARKAATPVSVTFASSGDIVLQLVLALIAGPVLLLIGAVRRPLFAYVSPEAHYRHRLVYADSRALAKKTVPPGPCLVFDSRAYVLAVILEIAFWATLFYAAAFEPLDPPGT